MKYANAFIVGKGTFFALLACVNSSDLPDSLRVKFPQLRPLGNTPTLVRINGIGTGMYGKRDFDLETGTYIKTHCLCVLFVPLVALGAYRVADAQSGWYFIGKGQLSSFAKSWNIGVLVLSLLFGAVVADHAHRSSAEYLAKQEVRRGNQALQSGNPMEAARIFRAVTLGSTSQAAAARNGLRQAVEQCFSSASPGTAQAAFRLLATLPSHISTPTPVVPDAYRRGIALVEKFRATNPEAALDLLREVAVFGPSTNDTFRSLEIDLLKAAIAAKPNNTNRVIELALVYEDRNQLEASAQLLAPYHEQLGATEGARILGQHQLAQGKYEDAYGLLYPYVQARLQKLREVERNYTNAMNRVYNQGIGDLNAGRADRSFYDAFKSASKTEKAQMVDRYVMKRMETDPGFRRAVAELTAANKILHVTLDLGMVQLSRAQNLADPAARKAELEAAEKTFLAIRGLAGGTDEYRLFLGQVYYWLGKSKEGGELFRQLLEGHKGEYSLQMNLGSILREVGEVSQARELVEQAYRTATADMDKFEAASLRARLEMDTDDQISWLEKCDPNNPNIQVELDSARGRKALVEGNRELAARFLRKAVEGYKNLPQNTATFNNFGLAYLDLYYAGGDINDHNRGLALIERAVALSPGNSLLLNNITQLLISRAYMDLIADSIRFAALKEAPGQAMLAHLYNDEQGRAAIIEQLRQNEHMAKAIAYLDKALLLAPKNTALYETELHLQETFRDLSELQKLQQRIRVAAPDMTETVRATRELYDPVKGKELRDRLQNEIHRYRTLLEVPAVKEHSSTFRFAEVSLNNLEQGAAAWGDPVDSQKLLEHAHSIEREQTNSATLSSLIASCFYRAHEELKQQNHTYSELAQRTRLVMAPRELMAFLLDRDDPLATAVRQNPKFLNALELLKEEGRLFPSFRRPDEWALFRTINAEEAALVSRQLKADSAGRLADEIRFQLNPISGPAVMAQYWTARLNGSDSAALAIYQQALKDGVPLPAL
ncbi:MAG TPA: hypothetical protein VL361_09795 [Candidatus Limnocylindrales bacterium]|nr:hypothetical protein [Candidatus Limnocylindrales bacterium]